MDSTTGELRPMRELDRDLRPQFVLRVKVRNTAPKYFRFVLLVVKLI